MPAESPSAKRIYRSKQERRRIAEESLESGASVAMVARSHGVNANQVFHWRKLLQEGRLGVKTTSATQLLPVRITEANSETDRSLRPYSGAIQIEVGRIRIRVEGAADPENLRIILEHLNR